MKAIALLAVTAALASLLAVLSHEAWPPVLVATVGTLPALYLAWLAVPGAVSPPGSAVGKPVHGRPVAQWTPVDLGVHQVIGGGPMPTYVHRPHDELLRAVLDPAVSASRLVVVRGGSSTGKTRAVYEAVIVQLPGWQLDYPLDPVALEQRLETGVPARTVLWLGEMRQYVGVDDRAKVLGRIGDLLEGDGRLVITTMWPKEWAAFIAAARDRSGTVDPAGTAGRLLDRLPEYTGSDPARIDPARGGIIDVPDQFTVDETDAAARAGDPVLAEAVATAARAGQRGQVTQYLAGVPDLLRQYEGSGGDPYGQAMITAAMDATRLGHASPLSAELLYEAAVGYLTGPQRTKKVALWGDPALAWATEELNGAVRALRPVPPPSGTGIVGYQVADYLDQYGRDTRQDQLGPPSLWNALAAHAAASDLTRLGRAAQDRGLYRFAADIWTAGAAVGSVSALHQLINHLSRVRPADTMRAAIWALSHVSPEDSSVIGMRVTLRRVGADDAVDALDAQIASHASLDDPQAVAVMLRELREGGAGAAVETLLARDPAAHVSLDNPQGIAELLSELRRAGADAAVETLLARDPAARVSLDNSRSIAWLLSELRRAGADAAVDTLAARALAVRLRGDQLGVAWLLRELRETGARDATDAKIARNSSHASLDDPYSVAWLLQVLQATGAGAAVETLLARDPAAHVSLDNPQGITWLLSELRRAGADAAVETLLARDPAAHVSLDNPQGIAVLLRRLWEAGAGAAVDTLAARAAASVRLDDLRGVAELMRRLQETGAGAAVETLLARDPAAYVSLDNPPFISWLLGTLRRAGADDAVRTLTVRAANAATFGSFLLACPDEGSNYPFGREPDRTPTQFWNWQEPAVLTVTSGASVSTGTGRHLE